MRKLVQEKILMEGDHLARRINELGITEFKEWGFLPWNPMWMTIFYYVEEEEEKTVEDKAEEEEGFGITRRKAGAK